MNGLLHWTCQEHCCQQSKSIDFLPIHSRHTWLSCLQPGIRARGISPRAWNSSSTSPYNVADKISSPRKHVSLQVTSGAEGVQHLAPEELGESRQGVLGSEPWKQASHVTERTQGQPAGDGSPDRQPSWRPGPEHPSVSSQLAEASTAVAVNQSFPLQWFHKCTMARFRIALKRGPVCAGSAGETKRCVSLGRGRARMSSVCEMCGPLQVARKGRQRAGPTANICTGDYNLAQAGHPSIQMRGEERRGPGPRHLRGSSCSPSSHVGPIGDSRSAPKNPPWTGFANHLPPHPALPGVLCVRRHTRPCIICRLDI